MVLAGDIVNGGLVLHAADRVEPRGPEFRGPGIIVIQFYFEYAGREVLSARSGGQAQMDGSGAGVCGCVFVDEVISCVAPLALDSAYIVTPPLRAGLISLARFAGSRQSFAR